MSTITFTAVNPVRPVRPATRLRLTGRGRRLLLALAAVPLASGITLAALSGESAVASGEHAGDAQFATVTVLPGDTLWGIAESLAPEADLREVIGDIQRLNMIHGGGLSAGQELAIPAKYTD